MPLYPYFCPNCNHEWEAVHKMEERLEERCPICGDKARIHFGRLKPSPHFFPEGWWEDLDVEPIYISSKRQLKEECKKRGLQSRYLLDS